MSEPVFTLTRRSYLTGRAVLLGANIFVAMEAVASLAIEHPEWDMEERRTWDEWESQARITLPTSLREPSTATQQQHDGDHDNDH
jgi:hypothetical protein